MPLNHRFSLVLLCLLSEGHFGALTAKFSLILITTQKIANLQNTDTPFGIIVSSLSYCAYHRSNILELLR